LYKKVLRTGAFLGQHPNKHGDAKLKAGLPSSPEKTQQKSDGKSPQGGQIGYERRHAWGVSQMKPFEKKNRGCPWEKAGGRERGSETRVPSACSRIRVKRTVIKLGN